MKLVKLFAVLAMILLAAPFVALAQETSDFAISDVDYNDPVNPGETLEVTVTLQNYHATYDVEDLTLKAWLEDQFGERVTDKAAIAGLQVQQDSERDFTLNIQVPEDAEKGEYNLVIDVDGKWEKTREKVSIRESYPIEIEELDDSLFIRSVELSKAEYSASDTVDVAVTVLNNGEEDQDNVNVAITVPALDIQKSVTLFGTLYAGTERTVYMTFQLPKDAAGLYTLNAGVSNSVTKYVASTYLDVKAEKTEVPADVQTTEISKELKVGKTETIKIRVENKAAETKDYLVTFVSENIDSYIEPASFSLAPGESRDVSIELKAREAGDTTANIIVQENEVPVTQLTLNAKVYNNINGLAGFLFLLIVLVAALAVYYQYYQKPQKTLYY